MYTWHDGGMTNTTPRFTVYDRKVSDLTTFSAVNPRYWVIDSTTNRRVDEFSSKTAATMAAKHYNTYGV